MSDFLCLTRSPLDKKCRTLDLHKKPLGNSSPPFQTHLLHFHSRQNHGHNIHIYHLQSNFGIKGSYHSKVQCVCARTAYLPACYAFHPSQIKSPDSSTKGELAGMGEEDVCMYPPKQTRLLYQSINVLRMPLTPAKMPNFLPISIHITF